MALRTGELCEDLTWLMDGRHGVVWNVFQLHSYHFWVVPDAETPPPVGL